MTLAHESKLGDFLADCLRFGGQTELSYMNTTSACGELLPGEITREGCSTAPHSTTKCSLGSSRARSSMPLLEAVYEPERFGNNAAIAFSGFHAAVGPYPAPAGRRFSLSRGRTVRPLRRTSASASRSAPIWPPAAMTPEPLPDRSPGNRPAATITNAVSAYAKSLGVLTVADYPRLHETGEPENNHAPY